jgi:hypothetical protein
MSKIVTWNDEKKELIEAYEKWEFISVYNLSDRKKDLQTAFKTTTSKRKSINIRVLE